MSAKLPGLKWLNLKQSVEQFSGTMVAQTRLDIEGEHLDRFNWNFGAAAWRDCAFPRVLTPRSVPPSKAVLVETFERGELVSKYTVEHTLGLGGESIDAGAHAPSSPCNLHLVPWHPTPCSLCACTLYLCPYRYRTGPVRWWYAPACGRFVRVPVSRGL